MQQPGCILSGARLYRKTVLQKNMAYRQHRNTKHLPATRPVASSNASVPMPHTSAASLSPRLRSIRGLVGLDGNLAISRGLA